VKAAKKADQTRSPETIPIWQKLEKIQIKNKKESIEAFMKILKQVESGKYKFEEGSENNGKYFVVNEVNRQGSNFVHIVPNEAFEIFEQMRKSMPNSFLGFSILCGKIGNKDVRVSCFAVPTSDITRAMIGKKK
jgi:hypothetical protein